jgi:hypothetical protein
MIHLPAVIGLRHRLFRKKKVGGRGGIAKGRRKTHTFADGVGVISTNTLAQAVRSLVCELVGLAALEEGDFGLDIVAF